MNKKIILIRHGESADKQPGQSDFDRVLTNRGEYSIQQLGKYIKQENIFPDVIISSTAQRTKQTALILAAGIGFQVDSIQFDDLLYNGSDGDYHQALVNSTGVAIIIGHNPALSFLVGKITDNYSNALSAGQAAWLEIEIENDIVINGNLIKLIGPFLE